MKIGMLTAAAAMLGIFVTISLAEDKAPTPQPAGKTAFEKMDANKDGKAVKEEVKEFYIARFKSMDANNDSKVSLEEFVNALANFIKEADADKDGSVSANEHVADHVPADTKAADASKVPAEIPADKSLFVIIDLDGDGNVTAAELAGWAAARFKVQDANSDGKLTADERKAAAEKWGKIIDTDKDGNISLEEFIIRWVGK